MCNCNRESENRNYNYTRESEGRGSNCSRESESRNFNYTGESESRNSNYTGESESRNSNCSREQHVHEFIGSTIIAERCEDCHSHRFATVSDEAIREGDSHVHKIKFRTDSIDGHFHEFCGTSGPAIWVGDGRHVHFVKACTESADGHVHKFRAASLIDDPAEEDEYC